MILLFLFAALAHAAPSATDPAWRALLHFPGAAGGTSSAAKDSAFFLSRNGYRDPQAELAATLHYFDEHPEEAACRFPARAQYLGRTGEGKSDWCERWGKWRQAIHARGAELVFAAAFLSSPSSMYGHTLLKFVRAGQSEGEDLLDYTLNYGANTGSVVGVPYIFKGLTGGFNGNYATAPFYLKVREYNYVENRDFWIYPLRLTPVELGLLVAHSWELRGVDFPYFFLHQNCAYYVLELLEVARPGSNFTSHFSFWTIPVDTIRLLQEHHLVGAPKRRVSRYGRLKALRAQLRGDETEIVERLVATGDAALPPAREALLLDAAYELWRYRTEGKKAMDPEVESKLLTARARYNEPTLPPPGGDFPPDRGHATGRAYLAYGQDRAHGFAEIGYRGALHDLLADPRGFEDYSELSMGDLRVRAEDGTLFLERFDILRLRSVAPRERWIPRWSWSFRTGFTRAKEFGCAGWGCSAGQIEGGGGVSAKLGPFLAFALAETGFEAGKPYDRGYRWGAGPAGGLLAPLWPGGRALLEGEWRWRLLGSAWARRTARLGIAHTFSARWEARVTGETSRAYREGLVQVNYYF